MKRYISKYLMIILTLVMILTPAWAVYADEPESEVEITEEEINELTEVSDIYDENAPEESQDDTDSVNIGTGGTDGMEKSEDPESADEAETPAAVVNVDGNETEEPEETVLNKEEKTEESVLDETEGLFSVIWMPQEESGKPLETDENIEAGTAPEYNGEVPMKESDGEYVYEFSGWAEESEQEIGVMAEELPEVTEDAVYYAAFRKKTMSAPAKALLRAASHVHSYGPWKVTMQANYFRAGSRTRKCSCGAAQTETMPKLVAKNKWVGYGGKLYYFDVNGNLFRGWHRMTPLKSTRQQWVYFNRYTGAYVKGIYNYTNRKWVEADNYRFYFITRPLGSGFQIINGRLYYLDNWDAVTTGTFKAKDGKTYTANTDGTIWGMPFYIHKYKTFILIDKSDQTLYYYRNKNFNMAAGVVTGLKGVHDTPRGTYSVRSKLRNIYLTGPTWRSYVNYWMAFIGSSYGIHDATWRSAWEFDDRSVYRYDGSHGCVNMYLSEASKLFYRVSIGTTVIVQE